MIIEHDAVSFGMTFILKITDEAIANRNFLKIMGRPEGNCKNCDLERGFFSAPN